VYAEISESDNGKRNLEDTRVDRRAGLKLFLKKYSMRFLGRYNSLSSKNMTVYLNDYFKIIFQIKRVMWPH